jgi:hypothetical protein
VTAGNTSFSSVLLTQRKFIPFFMKRGAPPGPTSRAGEDALHATSGRSLSMHAPSKKDTSAPHSTEATAKNSEYEIMACCDRE